MAGQCDRGLPASTCSLVSTHPYEGVTSMTSHSRDRGVTGREWGKSADMHVMRQHVRKQEGGRTKWQVRGVGAEGVWASVSRGCLVYRDPSHLRLGTSRVTNRGSVCSVCQQEGGAPTRLNTYLRSQKRSNGAAV